MEADNDLELREALAAGDVTALSRVYDAYGGHAFSVALRVLGDAGDAEDVVFECFLELWNQAGNQDSRRGSLRCDVVRTARSLALARLRDRERRPRRAVELAGSGDGEVDLWDEVALADVSSAVREGLAGLSLEQRQALELACFRGYSYREIAEATQAPAAGVKSALRLALEKLHSFLQVRGLVHEA